MELNVNSHAKVLRFHNIHSNFFTQIHRMKPIQVTDWSMYFKYSKTS